MIPFLLKYPLNMTRLEILHRCSKTLQLYLNLLTSYL